MLFFQILSGNIVVKDGVTICSSYGPELDSLREGDSIAVSRSSKVILDNIRIRYLNTSTDYQMDK